MSSLFDPGATGLLPLSIHHSNAPVLILLKNPSVHSREGGVEDAIPTVSRPHEGPIGSHLEFCTLGREVLHGLATGFVST